MSWLGSILGTESSVNNIIDKDSGLLVKGGTALSNLYYSDQEKANDNKELTKDRQDWGIRLLESLTPFKVVQRVLALSAMFAWIFMLINVVVAAWLYAITSVTTTVVKNGVTTTTVTGVNAFDMLWSIATSDFVFWPVLSIFALYTGGGTISALRSKK